MMHLTDDGLHLEVIMNYNLIKINEGIKQKNKQETNIHFQFNPARKINT